MTGRLDLDTVVLALRIHWTHCARTNLDALHTTACACGITRPDEIGIEYGLVLADGRLRILIDVAPRGEHVLTLLGPVAEPGEWAERPACERPS